MPQFRALNAQILSESSGSNANERCIYSLHGSTGPHRKGKLFVSVLTKIREIHYLGGTDLKLKSEQKIFQNKLIPKSHKEHLSF